MRQSGLRERKKQETRDALRLAALRLAVERGWDQVRVEDIAAEAGVSTRTFSNYFATKEEAFLATGYHRAERIAGSLAARPSGEPLWTALANVIADGFTMDEIDPREGARIRPTPMLVGEQLKMYVVVERGVAEAVAARIGADAERDLYPGLVAGAVMSAVRVTIAHWWRDGAVGPLQTALRDALGQVAAGLPVPVEWRK